MKLLLTPLKSELTNLIASLEKYELDLTKHQIQGRWYYQWQDQLILTTAGHGKVQFGVQCQYWMDQLKPKSLICVGAAGGLSRHLNPLDVVVASKIIEHDYHEKFDPNELKPTFDCVTLKDPSLQPNGFSLHIGPIASGDEDIVDVERAAHLYRETLALGVCWESAGAARAAKFNRIPHMEIRGITDNARSNVVSDFKKNLPLAMDHCAQVLLHELNFNI